MYSNTKIKILLEKFFPLWKLWKKGIISKHLIYKIIPFICFLSFYHTLTQNIKCHERLSNTRSFKDNRRHSSI